MYLKNTKNNIKKKKVKIRNHVKTWKAFFANIIIHFL
jgi:hypothetical protein